jgi:hypothetical protein
MHIDAYTSENKKMRVLTPRRDLGRFLMGISQMSAAAFAIGVLLWSGVNSVSLVAAMVASVLTMASVLIFWKRGKDGQS